jgi:hypothetical protein
MPSSPVTGQIPTSDSFRDRVRRAAKEPRTRPHGVLDRVRRDHERFVTAGTGTSG